MKALIITNDKFPNGNAGAVRQECLAKMMIECGYDIDIFGMGTSTNFEYRTLDKINYKSFRSTKQNIVIRIIDRLLFPCRVIKETKNNKYDVILIGSVSNKIIRFLKKYKKNNNCVLIHDSVEWYSPSEFKLGVLNPEYIIKNLLNSRWIDQNFYVISISKYLEKYYKNKNIKCIRIPFVLDVKNIDFAKKECIKENSKIEFMYAGMIGRKDHLKNFFEAVAMLSDENLEKINIKIYGCDLKYLIKTNNINISLYKKIKKTLQIYGRVDRKTIIHSFRTTNFTLLFRNEYERYAKAGFPTKVVESLTYKTPIFCNLSSDLGEYLKDGYDSIICKNESIEEIFKKLNIIMNINKDKLQSMKENSRKTAVYNFDYRDYIEQLKTLIEGETR